MPVIRCPVDGCEYSTPDQEAVIGAALLNAHATTHQAQRPIQAARVEKVKRPDISSAGTTEDWMYFQSRWGDYVRATKLIAGPDRVIQLLECCDEQLRRDLTRNAGGTLAGGTEEETLAAIKRLAVREENVMVARVMLHHMKQDRDESIRAFAARLRGQAGVCKYTKVCPGCNIDVSYTEAILTDVLCRGIADPEIQMDLLGDPNQAMTLEQALKYIEAKEAGKRSASQLSLPQSTDAVGSSYRRQRRPQSQPHPPTQPNNELCSYCGTKGHGKSAPTKVRRNDCPAFGTRCDSCDRDHHFGKMCRSRGDNRAVRGQQESALFDTLSTITSRQHSNSIDHHTYSQSTLSWKRMQSKSQPFLTISLQTQAEDYKHLGHTLRAPQRRITVQAMADTGCQSCLAGTTTMKRLGLKTTDLLPVSLKMHAANNSDIKILGAILVKIAEPQGRRSSRQMVYITGHVSNLFLSRETCTDLGIIPTGFPTTHCSLTANRPTAIAPDTPQPDTPRPCPCPRRSQPPPILSELPYPATEDNRDKLEKLLLDRYKASTFNTCDHQPLPLMDGPPLRLMIDPNAVPTAHHSPIPVPLHWQDEVKLGLDRDVRLGVLEQVPVGDPVTWCHRMVTCAKKNGSLRRTIDFQPLNAHATRETHHTQSPFHQARSIPSNTRKTVFDAWNGYHSVALHPADKHLTTFITPWGRYRYKTAPQGYIASGDGYTRRYDEIVALIERKTKCIDDTLLWSSTIEESFHQAQEWLDICGRHGITLNPEKFRFARQTVEFAGFEITNTCVRPCQKYTRAISDFPTPRSLTDIRSWFGLINQVAYAFSMSDIMLPFRSLLKPSTTFEWTDALQQAFDRSKLVIIAEIEHGVTIFDKEKPTCLATDWSKHGIGYWLFQKHCQCPSSDLFCCRDGWKITLVGSRFTHEAESRYAPIEGEALAVADALDKARHFVLGCKNLTIAVDHRPLLKIFGDRSLDISNTRLRNLKEKTLRYRFRMSHIPGVKNRASDTLSRHPSGSTTPAKMHLQDDVNPVSVQRHPTIHIPSQLMAGLSTISHDEDPMETLLHESLISTLSATSITTWEEVQTATSSDETMSKLLDTIEEGWPDTRLLTPPTIREYFNVRQHLYATDGIAIYKDRIVIPPSLRKACLTALHAAHQGTSAMTARAETSIFWPGITADIHQLRSSCTTCNQMAPSQAALPPTPPTLSEYPFQCICADYFHYKGHAYLVIVDRYTNWPILARARGGSKGLVAILRHTFATYGIPDELASDGGPEFTAHETTQLLRDWRVHHRLTSVAFPHGNCRAEIAVKTVKRIIAGNVGSDGDIDVDAVQRAILLYRNSPDPATKQSPATCLFGRPTRDLIPLIPGKYHPHPTWQDNLSQRETALRQRHSLAQERWTEHTRQLSPLKVGDRVRLQNQTGNFPNKWDRTGCVVEVKQFHQYGIRVDGSGRLTLRNRRYLRRFTPAKTQPSQRSILEDIAAPKPPNIAIHLPPVPQSTTTTLAPEISPPIPEILPPPAAPSPATPARPFLPPLPPTPLTVPPPATPQASDNQGLLQPRTLITAQPKPPLRRSDRSRKPPNRLGYRLSFEERTLPAFTPTGQRLGGGRQ